MPNMPVSNVKCTALLRKERAEIRGVLNELLRNISLEDEGAIREGRVPTGWDPTDLKLVRARTLIKEIGEINKTRSTLSGA